MGRPPVIPAEKKARIVMSVIAGEFSVAEAARREKVSEQSIGRWNRLPRSRENRTGGREVRSIETGGTARGRGYGLTQALGEAAVEIRVWKKSAENRLGPSRTSR